MTVPMEKIVIVGAGQAGGRAAQAARETGFRGEITIVGTEEHPPYERPPLSKEYLRGESRREEAYLHPPAFYEGQEIGVLPGTLATGIDRKARSVELSSGETLDYDRLLLATGATPRWLEGAPAVEGLSTLRTLDDCDALQGRMRDGVRLLVVGGGWISCEVAASAAQSGARVTMVCAEPFPLYRVLGPELGSYYRSLHEDHGVEVLTGERLASVEGETMVTAGITESGKRLSCDALVLGLGVVPEVGLAREAGIACDDGILANSGLRTSDPNVFAAGDAARAWHPGYCAAIRVEHWFNAEKQGLAAGRALAGESVEYREIPYFFSDQYASSMEYSGLASADDRLVLRGEPAEASFAAIWLRSTGVVSAVMTVNQDSHERLREMVGGYLTPGQAADERHEAVGASG